MLELKLIVFQVICSHWYLSISIQGRKCASAKGTVFTYACMWHITACMYYTRLKKLVFLLKHHQCYLTLSISENILLAANLA